VRGLVTSVTDPANGVTSYSYGATGNRISVTDARGEVTHYAFDDDGRSTSPLATVAARWRPTASRCQQFLVDAHAFKVV
jgi:YD repeat-containing protein